MVRRVFDKNVPHAVAILIMIAGFVAGAVIGYWFFDGRKTVRQSPQTFPDWIFPPMSPLVSPPAELPVVQPPTRPPPH